MSDLKCKGLGILQLGLNLSDNHTQNSETPGQ